MQLLEAQSFATEGLTAGIGTLTEPYLFHVYDEAMTPDYSFAFLEYAGYTLQMITNEILSALDEEINKLQQARALLTGNSAPVAAPVKRGPGRPKKTSTSPAKKSAKRVLSEEARAKIAAAQKARWAAAKKAAK